MDNPAPGSTEVAPIVPSPPLIKTPLSSSSPIGVTTDAESKVKDDGSLASIQNTATGAMLQQQQQAAKTIAALAIASTGAFCYPEDADALHAAVVNQGCSLIILNRLVLLPYTSGKVMDERDAKW